ncbi:MAG: hypothetical protein NTX52_13165 [Planctomycetota bacterium]|nr:hypothetical protein [Planctomycetota bacterium]
MVRRKDGFPLIIDYFLLIIWEIATLGYASLAMTRLRRVNGETVRRFMVERLDGKGMSNIESFGAAQDKFRIENGELRIMRDSSLRSE